MKSAIFNLNQTPPVRHFEARPSGLTTGFDLVFIDPPQSNQGAGELCTTVLLQGLTEMEAGKLITDLIQAGFPSRWNPTGQLTGEKIDDGIKPMLSRMVLEATIERAMSAAGFDAVDTERVLAEVRKERK